MDVKALQQRLRTFAAERDWQPFHSPKNLAMALMVESAELLELFQWLTTEQSHTLTRSAEDKERVADELADVQLYLLQLADHTGVDLDAAVEHKLRKNAQKHPAKHSSGPEPGPKGHLLLDWENVHPKGEELRVLVPEGTDVWLFHDPQQKVDASSHRLAYGADKVTLVPRSGAGKNALDFQLTYYIGYITARQPKARFIVVSNDKGYDPMLEHVRELNFDAKRSEFRKPPAPAVAAPGRPSKPRAIPTRKPVPNSVAPPIAALTVIRASEPSAAQIAWRAIAHLRKIPLESRPTNPESWQTLVETLIHEPVRDKTALTQRASELAQTRRLGLGRAPDAWRPVEGWTKSPPAPAGTTGTVPSAIKKSTADAKRPVPQPPAAPAGQIANKRAAVTADKKAALSPGKVATALKKPAASVSVPQLVQRVLASLKKMPDNKPTRRAGLMKFIATHVAQAPGKATTVQMVCDALEKGRHVTFDSGGVKLSYPQVRGQKTKAR